MTGEGGNPEANRDFPFSFLSIRVENVRLRPGLLTDKTTGLSVFFPPLLNLLYEKWYKDAETL